MTEETEQFDRPRSPEFDDAAIRRFFLGQLSGEEQTRFETQLFVNEDLVMRARLVECELADDYALGRLSAADRALFETKFLVSGDRKLKLEVSAALRDRFALAPDVTVESKTHREPLLSRLGLRQPAWRFAAGVAMVILLVAVIWFTAKRSRVNEPVVKRPPVSGSPLRTNHPVASPAPDHHETPAPAPLHELIAPSAIVRVTLFPSASAKGQPSVTFPPDERTVVRFQLIIRSNLPGPYRAELLSATGEPIYGAQSLDEFDTGKIDFDVPARLLKAGDYQIRISRVDETSSQGVATYYFQSR